ncbi:MAG: hypothetical protein ACTS2F_11590 [Thainema sp.]
MSEESKRRDVANRIHSANETAEQAHVSSTDKEDLASATHSTNIPVEDETDQSGEVLEDVPQRYSESYGTGVKQPPQSR